MAISSSRAFADIRHPVPFAYCDRCGFRYLHPMLSWQYEWRGAALSNIRLLVCRMCLDVPQENGRRPIIIGPDPIPVRDPRPGYAQTQMQGGPIPPSNTSSFILDSSEFGILDEDTLG